MAKIPGNESQVYIFNSFSALRENFLKEFKKKFCADILCPKDVAFILDSSGSIKDEDFEEEKEIVSNLMMKLDIGPRKDRVALVLFGTKSKREAEFGQYNAFKFQDVVKKLPKMNGRTRIDRALNMAENQIFPNARKSAYKIAMILTDGVQSTGAQGLLPSSKPLRDAGVRMIAVGIGVAQRERSLRLMTDRDEDVADTKNIQRHLQGILDDLTQNDCNPQPASARKPAECADEPAFKRECRKKAKVKGFCWDNQDYAYINCQKSCGFCPSP